jgi:hypothetical protein
MRRTISPAPTRELRLAQGLRRVRLAGGDTEIPLPSYSNAVVSACLFLISADRARLAGDVSEAIALVNDCADLLLDVSHAMRLLRRAP